MSILFTIMKFLKRLAYIKWLAFSLLFKRKTGGPVRLRIFFEKAGGAFVKLGQMLALRCDFLPPSYTKELLNLSGGVSEASFGKMHRVFVEEMNNPVGRFFSEFDVYPIVSGSLAQVYEAYLLDDTRVAVKIQRPNIKEIFEVDFLIISFFAGIIDFFRLFSSVYAGEIASDFISWTRKEFNFLYEAKNAEVAHRHSQKHPGTVIPQQYLGLTTSRVLIQEFIGGGVRVDEVLSGKAKKADLLKKGIDVDILSQYLVKDEMRQYFIDGFFHANPHPSNLVFLPGNKLAYLDFGITGEADKEKRIFFLRVLHSIAQRDVESMSSYFFDFTQKTLNDDIRVFLKLNLGNGAEGEKVFIKIRELLFEEFKKELSDIVTPWINSIDNPSSSFYKKSANVLFQHLIKLADRHNSSLTREMVLFFHTLSVLDMVGLQISPGFDIVKALGQFFDEYPLEKIEQLIKEGGHEKESGKQITSLTDIDLEFSQEASVVKKEREFWARERAMEHVSYYAERYDEIRSMVKNYK